MRHVETLCSACNGAGLSPYCVATASSTNWKAIPDAAWHQLPCPSCNGKGKITYYIWELEDFERYEGILTKKETTR